MDTELKWSLKDLYESFEDKDFQRDYELLLKQIEQLNQWAEENLESQGNEGEKIIDYLEMLIAVQESYIKLSSYSTLSKSVDAKNPEASRALERIESRYAELKRAHVRFQKWLLEVEEVGRRIDCSEFLSTHRFYIMELIAKGRYRLGDDEELLAAKLTHTGAKAWSKLQQLLTSTLLVDIELEGEERALPLSVVRNMAYDADSALRQKAFEAELKSYEKIADSSAAAINGIKGESIILGKMRGFDSPLDESLVHSRMSRKTLDTMLKAMEGSLPAFRRYLKQKAKLLGHEAGLPFYDLFAPIGKLDRQFSFPQAMDYVIENFTTFSENLGSFARQAYEGRWIDVEPREGKRGGGFCYFIRPIKQSRILLNFTGSFKNVMTLAHELGHGFHGHCLKDESVLNCSYPMPLAETASIFAETILVHKSIESGTDEEKFWILENTISHATQLIVDIYSRYLFEKEVFERRQDHGLTVAELNEIMLQSQRLAYGDGLKHQVLHPYMWVNKVHYYYPERHYYNFPYAFGLLFAKGLFGQYLKDKNTFPARYEELLRATGKMSVEEVAKIVDINLTDEGFWKESLSILERDIEHFIELSMEI